MSVNKLILKQLDKLKIAHINNFDELKNCYHISKIKEIEFDINKTYLVELNDVLLSSGNIYALNFNNGDVPKYRFMKIFINNIVGNSMIYVDAIYYDNDNKQDINEMWSGWLPTQEIRLVEEL